MNSEINPGEKNSKLSPEMKNILEWIYCLLIAVVIALVVKYFIGTPTTVQMDSMYSTLNQGDKLWLNRIPRTFKKMPKRGDIITFEAPTKDKFEADEVNLESPIAQYDYEPQSLFSKFSYYVLELKKTSYIKRVIALPGDYVEIKDGKVYINERELKEDYLDEGTTTYSIAFNNFTVPKNTVFAMGDHRSVSRDCRSFGCIPLEKIESVVSFRFWPFSQFGNVDKVKMKNK